MSGIDPAEYRRIIGRQPSGISVVTTRDADQDHAMTVDTLTSVSLDPILVLICVERSARFHDALARSEFFGASILGAHQRGISDWFATRGRPLDDQLSRAPYHRGVTGAALFDGANAWLEARVVASHPAGDHTIVVGDVVSVAGTDQIGPALVHYRGAYGSQE